MINRSKKALRLAFAAGAAMMAAASVSAQNPSTVISVDTHANRKPINPNIYGTAFATTAELRDLNATLNRSGGNNTTRYNWKLNADNRDFDWYFESIANKSAVPGEAGDTFIAATKAGGAQPLITIPMIPWVAKVGPNRERLFSFSVAKYGAQAAFDPEGLSDAGNGVLKSTGKNITGNDPNDANVPNSPEFQEGWIKHLVSKWGKASHGGLKYYIMDNETGIWAGTHRDVHPNGPTMEEIRDDIIAYGSKVKAIDPTALVVGPEEWGWTNYLYSGSDSQWGGAHGWGNTALFPDRKMHGGMDYMPWLLDQMHQYDIKTGKRLLDVFSLHCYPQGDGGHSATPAARQLLRNRSTRQLWDPNYVDESWIKAPVQLIPRMHDWVKKYYPGTPIAITEYNWGAENEMSGATAQADVLGIFGREGLDMATRWTTPKAATPTYKAMKIYRNYDGHNSAFGNISVKDGVENPDNVSSFAAVRSSDQALTVMVINKYLAGDTPATIDLVHFKGAHNAEAWQLTSANAITRLPDATVSGGRITTTLPAQSVTLFVIPAGDGR